MSKLQVRIPKPVVTGWFLSFVAMIVVSMTLYFVQITLPDTAYHKLYEFAKINNNNPAIYDTSLQADLAPDVAFFDEMIATPISLLFGGLVYGLCLRKPAWPKGQFFRSVAITGVVFSGLIVLSDLAAYKIIPLVGDAIERINGRVTLPPFTSAVVLDFIWQFVFGAVVYALGGWIARILRRPAAVNTSKALPSAVKRS